MQVFVPYPSPIDVAKCLDNLRLRKQIIECDQILKAISGESQAWKNHPVVKMYKPYKQWLRIYRNCLEDYYEGSFRVAYYWSEVADSFTPVFLTDAFCDQHKRRLYTKATELYPQFAEYGKSCENWYVVDGMVLIYAEGKLIKAVPESFLESHDPILDIMAFQKRFNQLRRANH